MERLTWINESPTRRGNGWVQRFTTLLTRPDGPPEALVREVRGDTAEELAGRVQDLGLPGGQVTASVRA